MNTCFDELIEAWDVDGGLAELPFTLSSDPDSSSRLLLDWKEETPADELGRRTDVRLVAIDAASSGTIDLGLQTLSTPLALDANFIGDGRSLQELHADLDDINNVAVSPLQLRSDRDLLIPFTLEEGISNVTLERVDLGYAEGEDDHPSPLRKPKGCSA